MRKLFVLLAMLFALTFTQGAMAKDKAPKEKTVKGCIHKDGDNFWLKTRVGQYHLMSKDDLTAHDGHEVKATGMYSKGAMPGDSSGKEVKHLEVSKVDMVADKCAMGTKKAPKTK